MFHVNVKKTIIPYLLFVTATAFMVAACTGGQADEDQKNMSPDKTPAGTASVANNVYVDTSADESLNLLARVHLDNGHLFEFYQPSDNLILISEIGRAGEPSRALRVRDFFDLGPSALYERLVSEPAPAALVDAEVRIAASMMLADSEEVTITASGTRDTDSESTGDRAQENIVTKSGCSASWFDDEFCDFTSSFDWDMCLLNWWDGAYGWCSGTDDFYTAVCADIGNITLHVESDIGYGGIWSVAQGHYRWYHIWGNNFYAKSTIKHASNNRFHFTVGCDF